MPAAGHITVSMVLTGMNNQNCQMLPLARYGNALRFTGLGKCPRQHHAPCISQPLSKEDVVALALCSRKEVEGCA